MSLLDELKRRNVLRVALAYLAGAWLLLQIADVILNNVGAADWIFPTLLWVIAVGFVPTLIFAWVFEWTPAGLARESTIDRTDSATRSSTRTFDRILILLLTVAVAYFALDKFVLSPSPEAMTNADRSVAVLPFVNMSEDQANEYFADGISEEMLNLLARIPELRVISRSSTFTFKGEDIDIKEVGEKLDVAHILEGSVRKSGDTVRITVQLIDARTDAHIWSETYDRNLHDIFAIQDEIAESVVGRLRVTLLGGVATARVVDPDAYNLFLQARYVLNQYDESRLPEARQLLQEALDIAPDYALAMAELARVHARMSGNPDLPEETFNEHREKMRSLTARAMALDPDNATVRAYYGSSLSYEEGRHVDGAEHIARAVELAPTDAYILRLAGLFARRMGKIEAANKIFKFLVSRDPLCISCKWSLAIGYRAVSRLDEADYLVRQILHTEYEQHARSMLGANQILRGDPQAALSEFNLIDPSDDLWAEGRAMAFHDLGRLEDFEREMEILRAQDTDMDSLAFVYAWIGDSDAAFAAFDFMLETFGQLPRIMLYSPELARLHSDPRWAELMARNGKPLDELERIELNWTLPD